MRIRAVGRERVGLRSSEGLLEDECMIFHRSNKHEGHLQTEKETVNNLHLQNENYKDSPISCFF